MVVRKWFHTDRTLGEYHPQKGELKHAHLCVENVAKLQNALFNITKKKSSVSYQWYQTNGERVWTFILRFNSKN